MPPRHPFRSYLPPRPQPNKPPPAQHRIKWWVAAASSIIVALWAVSTFLLDRTEKCKESSQAAIDLQHRLDIEILTRRDAFVDAVTHAVSMGELREFSSHHDELHGFVYKEFADRSLADLSDAQTQNTMKMDEPDSLASMLFAEFIHQIIQDEASPDGTVERLRGEVVWRALQAQDVGALVDMDLPTLKDRAAIERGWLFELRVGQLREIKLVAACSVGVTIQDVWHDYVYLNRPATHVIHRED